MKEKRTVKWVEPKIPSELELDMFPDADWSDFDKYYTGEILDTVIGIWEDYFVVYCSDGSVRRVNIDKVKEIKDGKK